MKTKNRIHPLFMMALLVVVFALYKMSATPAGQAIMFALADNMNQVSAPIDPQTGVNAVIRVETESHNETIVVEAEPTATPYPTLTPTPLPTATAIPTIEVVAQPIEQWAMPITPQQYDLCVGNPDINPACQYYLP